MTDTVALTKEQVEAPTGGHNDDAPVTEASAGGHEWVAGTDVPVSPEQARQITVRDTFMIHEKTWARARRVYCNWCNQDYSRAVDRPCPGPQAEHLHGGTPGERAKRTQVPAELRADNVAAAAFMQRSRIDFIR
ncbi:hypothetical protein ABT352_32780 [Streptosporangium sp. NPDC000563]|uniref:hypothetical protein n=1 Tax=Streptosporangium sp. NPDC000563 TaxID=3154366 RepID=UPI00331EBA30